MRTRMLRTILPVLLVAVAIPATLPARASEVVEVQAVVEGLFPGPGGDLVVQLEWGVRNITADAEADAVLNAYIVYSNGLRQQVFPPTVETLGPGDGVIKLAFVIVPQAAGSGPATFHAEARVGRVVGGDGGSGSFATDSDGFQVP